jgi:hypothetical protein
MKMKMMRRKRREESRTRTRTGGACTERHPGSGLTLTQHLYGLTIDETRDRHTSSLKTSTLYDNIDAYITRILFSKLEPLAQRVMK